MKTVDLNGIWKINPKGEETTYPVQVPGSVLAALLEAKAIPDPYYRRNEYLVREQMQKDYIFYREFEIEEAFLKEEQIELVCEGLDTLAEICLNGEKIFDVNNMHRTWRIPVKERLWIGKNQIRITFHSVFDYIEQYSYSKNKRVQYTPCGAIKGNQLIRKAHSMFGWDWGPQLPDAGIFRDIFLEGWTGRKIREIELQQKQEADRADIKITVKFKEDLDVATSDLSIEGFRTDKIAVFLREESSQEVIAYREENLEDNRVWEGFLSILNPKLWWPNGYGEQALYQLKVVLMNLDGEVKEEQNKIIGIRTLTVSRAEDLWGKEFAFMVNGKKIFAMGANYIPEDCIYSRITEDRQDDLLESAKRAHFNCIRVWGGGYYPSEAFYELCDRKGLIVWQDFMFACNVYDVTDDFLENCRQEVIDNVRRLRYHPCLGLWCGNNEIESAWDHWGEFQKESPYLRADYIRLFEHTIPEIVKKLDPDTFFWPSSPSSGGCFANPDAEQDGDAHYWDVWHGQKPFTNYQTYFFRFCSEFGFQSFPCFQTIKTFTEPEDRNIFSRVMESHQKNYAANGKLLYYISENFRYPCGFEELLYISQVLQGMAIQYGVEHWRRNRGRCMGTLYWQLNDIWPVASWSSIDYFGRWKALHYMAQRFYAPVATSLVKEKEQVCLFIENETNQQQIWHATIFLKDMDCRVLGKVEACGSTAAFCSEKILEMAYQSFVSEEKREWEETVFLESRVKFLDGTETVNVEPLVPYKYLDLKKGKIAVSVEETETAYILRLASEVFAAFVELSFADADVIFEDNYFYITETEAYRVLLKKTDILRGSFSDGEDVKKRLRVFSLVDSYQMEVFEKD